MESSPVNINIGGDVVFCCHHLGKRHLHGRFTFSYLNATFTGDAPMAITLPDDKPVQVKVSWVDAHQNLGVVDGSTVWASSDEAQVIATPDPTDSTLATLTSPAGGAVNITAQVTATADSDLGSGVVPVIAMVDVTVVAGTVVAGTISPVPAPGP